MDTSGYGNLQKCLKSLSDEEVQGFSNLMADLSEETVEEVFTVFEQYRSSSVVNGTWFCRVFPVIAIKLNSDNLLRWLEDGKFIARGNWESSLAFLKHNPETLNQLGEIPFLDWVRIGRLLVRYSYQDAIGFFKSGGTYLKSLEESQRLEITKFVLGTIEYSWPAAMESYKILPELIVLNDPQKFESVLQVGNKVVLESPEVAGEYFLALPSLFAKVDAEYLEFWVKSAGVFPKHRSSRQMIANYFKYTPAIISKVNREDASKKTGQWVAWGNRLGNSAPSLAAAFFENTPNILKKLKWEYFYRFVDLAEMIEKKHSLEGALAFTKNAPGILTELDIQELEEWVNFGLNDQKPENMLAYFLLKSQESRDAISTFRKGLHLDTVKKILMFYCEGLTGEKVKLRTSADLPSNIHGDYRLFCTLDTQRIYLPVVLKTSNDSKINLNLYKGMIMHQVAHREFGTLDLGKEIFKEFIDNEDLGLLFELIEDWRVDQLAKLKYSGLKRIFSNQSLLDGLQESLPQALNDIEDIEKILNGFCEKVIITGASAKESMLVARRILELLAVKGSQETILELPQIPYRGKLKYDLLYMSKVLDEENLAGYTKVKDDFDSKGGFSPHQEFYLRLKKLLAKFLEDEENPYRLIAYYDEWDQNLNDFKKDWCKVREILLKPSTARFVNRTLTENYGMINTLKRYFGMLKPDRFKRYKRQADGDDIDIDAVIEAMVEKEAGTSSAGGFYIRRDKRERDVAVAFLMDLSYSTDEVIPSSNKTLLEVEQEAVIVMAEALEVLGDKYGIYGFTSDGREKINFYVVKDFDEAYTQEVKQRFGGLKSYGMTRLASAVRHATNKLEQIKAAIKILIIISDGRPFDFDYHSGLTKEYEEYYTEADTKMALRETKMKGVNPFCITVDSQGQDYMNHIYGNVNYIIIDNVNHLPIKLTEIYKNLTS